MAVVTVEVILCLVWVTSVLAAPIKTYDQRQQGDLNIHAQLDNIVVVVIPSARLNLLEFMLDTKVSGEKGGFLQMLQKLHKADIDRYETVTDEVEPQAFEIDIRRPVTTTPQQVSLNHEEDNEEKEEEEVVATVEEMKPEPTEKTTQPTKAAIDDTIKKQSTISEAVKESVITVTLPVEVQDDAKDEDKEIKVSLLTEVDTVHKKTNNELDKTSVDKLDKKDTFKPMETEVTPEVSSTESFKEDSPTIEDYIHPVAAKEEITPASNAFKKIQSSEEHSPKKFSEPLRLQEGARKEKVIRYKPDAKWAPELVDLLGPPRQKPKDIQERRMFADLCSPGSWDPELRTCIMPGETRR